MVKPLSYNDEISLEEAQSRYAEVRVEFQRVKAKYSGFGGMFRRNIREEDNKSLADCVRVLFPLAHQESVKEQLRQSRNPSDELVFIQASELQVEIMLYLSGFNNSGVKRVQ